jgi:hypothetical protein
MDDDASVAEECSNTWNKGCVHVHETATDVGLATWQVCRLSWLNVLHGNIGSLYLPMLPGKITHFASLRHTHVAGRSLSSLIGVKVGLRAGAVSIRRNRLIMNMETWTEGSVISKLRVEPGALDAETH